MLPARANPLRQPKPDRSHRLLQQRVYPTDERGALVSQVGMQLVLSRDVLWLHSELAIPVGQIASAEIVERRGLIKKRLIQLTYVNPITGGRELLYLAALDFLGFYERKPLERLRAELERARALSSSTSSAGWTRAAEGPPESAADPALQRCEVCGARPAYYVPYVFQLAALIFVYRSGSRRRIHCRRHNLWHGLAYYLLTALAGWPALIPTILVSYPLAVYTAGRNLSPALGRRALVLAVVPPVLVVGLIAWTLAGFFSG